MTTVRTRTRAPAELGLWTRLVLNNAATWTIARGGDPLARLLHAPWRRNPYPLYEQLRLAGPLVRSRLGVWAATSHELCESILRDPRFGVRKSTGEYGDPTAAAVDLQLSLLGADPPEHTRLRRFAAPAFRPRKLENYRERIDAIARELLEREAARGEFDLVRDFAAPLPIRVICELLDLPPVGLRELAEHGAVLARSLDGIRSPQHLRRMRRSTAALDALFTALVEQRRRRPGDDVVSDLVTAFDKDLIKGPELVQLCNLLLVAGFETTVNLIGNAMLAMCTHVGQWRMLCERPELAEAAVEETLRWDPPVQATMRLPHEPVEIGDRRLPVDSVVMVLLGSAGRDPVAHAAPDRFDISRTQRGDHLAFSSGIHYCLGAPLARMESEVALRLLASALPDLRQSGPPVRRPTTILRGLSSMPVRATARTR